MAGERVERRLAAVLAADVAGYSRLMGGDEEGTLARLKAARKAVVDPAIASHRGRIVKTTGDGLLVEGDRNKLIQVFVNLLTNACDASSTGARVEVSAKVDNGSTRIAVADKGQGIPESMRDRIFEPFFTTKVAGEGTGLGLSLVYSIVREHRGTVEVKSAEGRGTTITVVLPRAEAS